MRCSPSPIDGGSIVAPPQLYGTTHTLLAHTLKRHGIEARFAKSDRPEDIAALIDETTRAVFCETVGNPAGNICDIEALAEIAHEAGAPLDRRQHRGDADPHAADRLRRRHRRALADQVHGRPRRGDGRGDRRRRPLRLARRAPAFSSFSEPDESYHGLIYVDRFGREAFIARARSVYQRTTGAVLAPMSAFLILQGIETLALRVERHVENARVVAYALREDARVAWVEYAGFEDHRYHAMAKKYLNGRVPSLLTFGVRGGHAAAKRFYDALKLVKRLVNIGDTRTLCCHPASTTHRQMTPDEQTRAGVSPETVRLCVGVEHIDDILEDLDQALAVAVGPVSALAAE